jgi:5-methylcytosine-specific restriction enzyme subunit McrC
MNSKLKNIITVFEHQAIFTNKGVCKLTTKQLEALQNFYKEVDFPYYTLVYKGIRFCEYVGVLQVGNLTIEILPKADKDGEEYWRKMLIDMLRAVGLFKVNAPSNSNLSLKNNSVLDLYFELFIQEVELLLHKGLIKKYRKTENNIRALKGSLLFSKQLQKNLVHQERFYTRHTIYDREHPLNCVLYKALLLLKHISTNQSLQSRIGALLINFPELSTIKTDDTFFEKIQYNRKTESYKPAIDIARLILLNYHPDVNKGSKDVLALLFDMNSLWEKFVFISLRKYKPLHYSIKSQMTKQFWKKDGGRSKKMIPDIVIDNANNEMVVLDTKWKNIETSNPTDADLRQMYAYSKFHNNAKTALLYPGLSYNIIEGIFYDEENNSLPSNNYCGIITVAVEDNIKKWQVNIANKIFNSSLFS